MSAPWRELRVYPPAKRTPLATVMGEKQISDPYRWLEDTTDPRTIAWSAAQDELWGHIRAGLRSRAMLRDAVAANVGPRWASAPVWRGDYGFVLCREAGEELASLYLIMPDGQRHCLVDLMAIDPEGTTSMRMWQPSADGRRLAYTLSREGSEDASLYVLDVPRCAVIDGPIDGCGQTSVAWLPGGDELYLSRRSPPGGESASPGRLAVYWHGVGADPGSDVVVAEAPGNDPNFFRLAVSKDGQWLSISVAEGSPGRGNDLWLADLRHSPAAYPKLRQIQDRSNGNSGLTFGQEGRIYALTNRDAPYKRIALVDSADPDYDHWRELIAGDPAAVIADLAELRDTSGRRILAVSRTRMAIAEITLHDGETGTIIGSVPLPGHGSIGPLIGNAELGDRMWFSYTDMATPPTVLVFQLGSGEVKSWEDLPQPGAHDVRTHRLLARSSDGTDVQMIIAESGNHDGPRAAIISGYGGFGISMVPAYSASALSWIRAGGIYVITNIRGGGEQGKEWHAAGRRQNKQRSIDDFIACAEHLIATGWTSHDQLAAFGGSNGGLLVGAAITQRPDLFAVAVCMSPLMDMVRYEALGFGPWWRGEYGSAAEPEELKWLLGYSPYHNVSAGRAYPATLMTVGANDDRVDPAHARKMTAALQHATAAAVPVVLRLQEKVGHGSSSVSRSVELSADVLAFIAEFTGLEPGGSHPRRPCPVRGFQGPGNPVPTGA